jgi:hypothetical protein
MQEYETLKQLVEAAEDPDAIAVEGAPADPAE